MGATTTTIAGTMDLKLTWGELARACGGQLVRGSAEDPVSSLGIDSRKLGPDQAFWAVKGARTDGHDFLDSAKNAAGWVIQRGRVRIASAPPHLIEVPDTLKALQALAAFHRKRFDIPVAAVAGSNGKTSTKEMLRSIAAQSGAVCATQGNFNNQFGLPLSVLELLPSHRYGVFEMGESHAGDIDELTRIAQPTVGVLTNVGAAHLEFFGSLEGVFKCLIELVSASPETTRVAVNLDDAWLAGLEGSLGTRAITYGTHERASVRLLPSPNDRVELLVNRHKVSAKLGVAGKVHQRNACAAAAGAVGLGLGPDSIVKGIESFSPAPMRFEPKKHSSGAWLLVDAYNANPGSMRAGIDSFCDAYAGSRLVLVLGDMKELGPDSPSFHRELGEFIGGLGVAAVFLAGKDMAEAAAAVRKGSSTAVHHAEDPSQWLAKLRALLAPGTAVYFKASRAMQFEGIIGAL
ncbi:MAG: UDP-N-acetylmuramoyl-tripeptide--D-alanyl-D-alanine ligase [Elusimicrobia bacterium]|nr:UDP-N-acetylmuramoyl-tripeptide--D-alanyl-D-alanine ligase [Elusimicrobiota bacterium]